MKNFYKLLSILLLVFTSCSVLNAQNRFFKDANEAEIKKTNLKRTIVPQKYRTVGVNPADLRNFLWSLPLEKTIIYSHNQAPVLELPMPDGRSAKFHVWQSSIQEAGLEAKFPEIKTFAGQGIDDPYASIRFDYTDFGFHAQILSVSGDIYIDPYARGNINNYISYFTADNKRETHFVCEVAENAGARTESVLAGPCRGTALNTYRLAVACTGEYAAAVGGTTPALLHSAIVTSVNRVVGVYQTEIAMSMVLVANNNIIEFLTPAADPFTTGANNDGGTLIGESQTVITNAIGSANFDIGHTFSTGGGGLAGLGVVCNNGQKASGVTGLTNPVGDNYDIDYVAHEMGHQFGGNHPFNSSTGACGGGNRNGGTAYEVGSGTTIMAYAGICGSDDIQPHSDPFFHTISFDEISNYHQGTGGTCGVETPNGNTLPVITSMGPNNLSIPPGTPFTLTGAATDADGDAITYNWEEWDKGPSTTWNGGATSTTAPLFKSRAPKTSGSRTFPDISLIAANYVLTAADLAGTVMDGNKGETLPTIARVMKFRLTVRDNRAGGSGIVTGGNGCQTGFTDTYQVNVSGTTAFAVTVPNGGESYVGGSSQTVTWNTAGTIAAPFNVANVKISLSTDGGLTYPTIISASTPNDGSESVAIPAIVSTTARIKIEAIANVFFDISNANFIITAPAAGYTFNSVAATTVPCGSTTAVATLATTVIGTFTTPINLVATGNPVGTTVTFSTNPLTPGNSTTVTLNNVNTLSPGTYSVTVTGTAGSVVQTATLSFVVQPGSGPGISAQPVPATVCTGSSASFNAVALGSVSYQWQVSTDGGVTFTDIPGATNPTYTIPNTVIGQNGNQYQAVISTFCGSTTSNAVLLTVNAVTVISAQPPADVSVCAGVNNTFTVAAAGSGLTYQWQMSPTGCNGTFTDIPGATSASYTLTGITLSQDGSAYQVIVTGACGNLTSTCSALHVSGTIGILTQPTDLTACSGTTATFTVAASGTGVNYQWQVSTDGGVTFTDIPGATAATLSITNVPATSNGNQYQVLLTNSSCTTPSTSAIAILTVNQTAAFSTQPQSANVCEGTDVTFTGAAVGTAVSYQWSVSTDGGTTYTPVAGATSASLTITGVTAAMNNNLYQLTITNTCAPAGVASNAATLTVDLPASITTQPSATAACEGSTASFTATVSGTGNLQWQVSTDNGVTFTDVPGATGGATLTLPSVTADMNNHIYQLIVNGCNSITSTQAVLTVNALPVVVITASPYVSLTTGLTTTLTATSTPPASVFSWYKNDVQVAGVTGNTIEVNHDELGAYKAVATDANGCSNTSGVLTITDSLVNIAFIYPNPNGGSFHVRFQGIGFNGQPRIISMYDAKGARVFSQDYVVTIPYQVMDVNAAKLSKGTYVLVLSDVAGNTLGTGKVVLR